MLRLDLRDGTSEELAEVIGELLERSSLSAEERVQLLGGLFVTEALREHWVDGRSPAEAHDRLRGSDPELAAAIEQIAPMLLGRAEAMQDAAEAIAAVQDLLRR
jgi:hypothetical protein